MTELRQRMIADMTSAGLAPSTKEVYLRGVRSLAAFYRRSPDQLSETEVRSYLLHLRDQRGVARGTYTPHHGGIRFFFAHTLDREWSLFSKKESTERTAQGPLLRPVALEPARARRASLLLELQRPTGADVPSSETSDHKASRPGTNCSR